MVRRPIQHLVELQHFPFAFSSSFPWKLHGILSSGAETHLPLKCLKTYLCASLYVYGTLHRRPFLYIVGKNRRAGRSWNDFSGLNSSDTGFKTVSQLFSLKLFHNSDEMSQLKTLSLLILIFLVFEKFNERNVFRQTFTDKASCGFSTLEIIS